MANSVQTAQRLAPTASTANFRATAPSNCTAITAPVRAYRRPESPRIIVRVIRFTRRCRARTQLYATQGTQMSGNHWESSRSWHPAQPRLETTRFQNHSQGHDGHAQRAALVGEVRCKGHRHYPKTTPAPSASLWNTLHEASAIDGEGVGIDVYVRHWLFYLVERERNLSPRSLATALDAGAARTKQRLKYAAGAHCENDHCQASASA